MQNVDGTTGEHWSFEQCSSIANQYGIKCYSDWYYAMNSLWSDLSKTLDSDAHTYAKIAKALYFDDPDMSEGKLFKQWVAVSQNYN